VVTSDALARPGSMCESKSGALALLLLRRIPATGDGVQRFRHIARALEIAGNDVVEDRCGGRVVIVLQIAAHYVVEDRSGRAVFIDVEIVANRVARACGDGGTDLHGDAVVVELEIVPHGRTADLVKSRARRNILHDQIAMNESGRTE